MTPTKILGGRPSLAGAALVLLLFISLSILLTWPLAFHLDAALFRGYGDVYGHVWGIWIDLQGLRRPGVVNHFISAPFGDPNGFAVQMPVLELLVNAPARLFGEVVAYNLLALLSFPLTAFATYLFLRWAVGGAIPAFLGGIVFGFCPGAVMHASTGHLGFSFNAFVPLFLWALFYNRSRRSLSSSLLTGASYALLTLTSLYWGYFALYIILAFVVFDRFASSGRPHPAFWRSYALCGVFSALIILPFEYQWIVSLLSSEKRAGLAEAGVVRGIIELVTLSARPWDYLLPSIDHPVMGKWVWRFIRGHLHGSNVPEQTLYLGYVPMGLFLAGIFFSWKKRLPGDLDAPFRFLAGTALWMMFLSAPPYVPLGAIKVPTLSYFAHFLAPVFRAYCRFGIMAVFFVACAAAIVAEFLKRRMDKVPFRALSCLLLSVLFFEYWSVPPGHVVAVDSPPPVYRWLADQPGDFIVAEYPMMENDEASFYSYLFWQRLHRKRIVNGTPRSGGEARRFFESVRDLERPDAVRRLREAGVEYVIVHAGGYRDGQIPGPLKRYYPAHVAALAYNEGKVPRNPSLPVPHKTFGEDFVFRISEPSISKF
jgi:hypothetical protein